MTDGNDGGGKIWLHRKARESQVFLSAELWQLWTFCLMEAAWKEHWVSVKTGAATTQVKLLPGQCIFGRKEWARRLRQKQSPTYNRMLKLTHMGNITFQPGTHYSVVTVCKWDTYQRRRQATQQATQQAGNRQATGRQQAGNTPEEGCNKDKEGKEGCTAKNPPSIFVLPDGTATQPFDWRAAVNSQHPLTYKTSFSQWQRTVEALFEIGKTRQEVYESIMALPENSKHWALENIYTAKEAKPVDVRDQDMPYHQPYVPPPDREIFEAHCPTCKKTANMFRGEPFMECPKCKVFYVELSPAPSAEGEGG